LFCFALVPSVTCLQSGGCHGICCTRVLCFRLTHRRCSLTDCSSRFLVLFSGALSLLSAGRNSVWLWHSRSAQFGQDDLLDGVMGDHVARRYFIDLQTERASANFLERRVHAFFIGAERICVGHACGLCIVLRLAKATIIAPYQNLDLRATSTVSAENIKIGIARDLIE